MLWMGARNDAEVEEILGFVTEKIYSGRMYFSAVAHMMAACAFHSVLPDDIDLVGPNPDAVNVTNNPLDDDDDDDDDADGADKDEEAANGLD